jgi:hypothetical protein
MKVKSYFLLELYTCLHLTSQKFFDNIMGPITTLALALRPRQGLAKVWAKSEPRSHISCSWECKRLGKNEPLHSQMSFHFGVGPVVRHIVYYKGEGDGFPQVQAVVNLVNLVSPSLPMAHPSTKSAPTMH